MSLLLNRSLMIGGVKHRLPKEYQEVKWIGFYRETTTAQCNRINTEYKAVDNVCVIVEFGTEQAPFDELGAWLIGLESSSTYDQMFGFGITSGKAAYGSVNGEITTDVAIAKGVKHTVMYNDANGMTILDGQQISDVENKANLTYTGTSIMIGRRGRNNRNYNGVVYDAKIIDNATGKLLRHYIPCYVKQTNVATFYDIVTKSEATIKNTSEYSRLVAGPNV